MLYIRQDPSSGKIWEENVIGKNKSVERDVIINRLGLMAGFWVALIFVCQISGPPLLNFAGSAMMRGSCETPAHS